MTTRPSNVVWFERFMYVSVGIDVILSIPRWVQLMAKNLHYGVPSTMEKSSAFWQTYC